MMINISFYTFVLMILFSTLTVTHAAEPKNPCPREHEAIVADMCTDDSKEESSLYGSKPVDSVLLRITKQLNNCICHVTLPKTVINYTLYMFKYEGLSNSAPQQQNCGLAVDVEYIDTSNTTQSLQPIDCTSGTSMRSIALGGNEFKLKSRIIAGDFTRGYCMQIYRNQALYTCNMLEQVNYAGSDGDWIVTNGTQHTSFDECKKYCRQTEACTAVHYDYARNYCFVYNRTTTVFVKEGSSYAQKQCSDTQKLKIMCYRPESTISTSQGYPPESTTKTSQVYPPESTTKTSQVYPPESTTKTSQVYPPESTTKTSLGTTIEENRSTKTETVTTPISNNPETNLGTQSTITLDKDATKERQKLVPPVPTSDSHHHWRRQFLNNSADENSDLYVYLGAAAGGVLMILLIVCIIVCIRKRYNQTSLKEKHNSTQQFRNDKRDSDGLKDNILYVSSEPNEIMEDGNYNTVDLEHTRKVNQRINYDGDYSTVDGTCTIIGSYSDSSLSKSKPAIKPKPQTNVNSSFKRKPDEEAIHLSTMDNCNNEYAVVDKGRNSDAVKPINPVLGNDTEYAVVDKVRKSSKNN